MYSGNFLEQKKQLCHYNLGKRDSGMNQGAESKAAQGEWC